MHLTHARLWEAPFISLDDILFLWLAHQVALWLGGDHGVKPQFCFGIIHFRSVCSTGNLIASSTLIPLVFSEISETIRVARHICACGAPAFE